ncbi:MAG: hypothetical protein SVZ03_08395 [Spirochaetota bacterium]|nr:hypothetical protein [Spirochaetota bacterium]
MRVYRLKRSIDTREIFWKRRPSEISGYHRTLYVTTEDSDYIRVDYNMKEKRVRLYIEDSDEGGNPYYAVIANGKVVVERNATTGRVVKLYDKFSKRAKVFSTIPNGEVLKLINNNYGIAGSTNEFYNNEWDITRREIERKKELERTRRKYFRPEEASRYVNTISEVSKVERRLGLIDLLDFTIGIFLCVSLYMYNRNIIAVGMLSAVIGIIMGFVDIFYRKRLPFFMKMVFFVIFGIASYIYGYYSL